MNDLKIVTRLRQFLEDEARSCSMDYGCVSPLYVYRMWGGNVEIKEIIAAFNVLKETQYGAHLYGGMR